MEAQKQHCIDQVNRFSGMLAEIAAGTSSYDRSRDQIMAQLFFNLGRYVEIANADGRALWRQFEAALVRGDYAAMKL